MIQSVKSVFEMDEIKFSNNGLAHFEQKYSFKGNVNTCSGGNCQMLNLPSEKRSILKWKNLAPTGRKFFPFRVYFFSECTG